MVSNLRLPSPLSSLVTQHSVDVQLLNVANGKRKLERLVITRGKFKSRKAAGALTEAELKTLLSDHVKVRLSPQLCMRRRSPPVSVLTLNVCLFLAGVPRPPVERSWRRHSSGGAEGHSGP